MASIGRTVMSVGTLLGAIGLVRIQVLLRRAHSAHPQQIEGLLARVGYSDKFADASLMIIGYQYAVLRRPFLQMSGTSVERHRSELLLWFAVMFIGVALGIVGVALDVLESRAI
jgi:hypothetical protein